MFVARNYGFAMIFVTPLALMMSTLVAPVPIGPLLRDRAIETLVGAAIGLALTLASREHRADVVGTKVPAAPPVRANTVPVPEVT